MDKEKRGFAFLEYIRQYRFALLMFLLFAGIFGIVFFLYNIELEAVLYASGLCLLLSLAVLSASFVFYLKRSKVRRDLLLNIEITDESAYPSAKTAAEQDYLDIIRKLKGLLDENITLRKNDKKESVEYYTAWVHQIKTPISVMEMILQSEDTPEHLELSAQLFRIEQYVEMVLNYVRLGDEASDFVFGEYPLDGIIKQTVHKYAPQFIRKRISLDYPGTNIKVLTDEKWLLFILEQLLSNAIKYTEEGKVSISVTEDKKLSVSDTGIGIAKEDIPRIFEKGFTGYNGRSNKKSTGLGLFLTKQAADKLSHKLSVTSEPGKGTTIVLDLNSYQLTVD